ncbi:putative protein EIN4-like [Capsicum annuum]|nr:putative protein EIN4-like [Capsicum annuum]
MNYPSSFSLGITQLDSNEKDMSLGFVPGTFDEQDPKFAENQSKHKNVPVTMKKLKDKVYKLPSYMFIWPSLEAYKGKLAQQTGLVNEIPFDVDYVQNIPQQLSDSLDCGVFVCAYAEILSEEQQVHSCGFDATSQRARYASLLWHYGVEKANEGYRSDNGDPSRPMNSVLEEIDASAIVTLE